MIRTIQVTNISFDCSLDDDDWTEQDQLKTEENLPKEYIGQVYELEVDDDASDDDVVDQLLEEITCECGWCINDVDFIHVLK